MKKTLLIVSAGIVVLSWLSCQYKKEVTAYPPVTCDTSAIKYSNDIVPILQANCYVCHSDANAPTLGGGNKLEGYNNIKPYAQFGLIPDVLTRANNPMPKGMPKLSDCNIAKIRTWVRNGYPNN